MRKKLEWGDCLTETESRRLHNDKEVPMAESLPDGACPRVYDPDAKMTSRLRVRPETSHRVQASPCRDQASCCQAEARR